MPCYKYKHMFRYKVFSKLCAAVRSLRKENTYLKKTVSELSHQQAEHNKILKRLIAFECVNLEDCQQLMAKDEAIALLSELSREEEEQTDVVSMTRKSKVHVPQRTARNQEQDTTSDEGALADVQESHSSDVLEKIEQALEHDQQKEKQVLIDNQAFSREHGEDLSHEEEQICQMKEHYKRLPQKASDELEQVHVTAPSLGQSPKWYEERQSEMEEPKQQQQAEKMGRKSGETAESPDYLEDEEQRLREVIRYLWHRLDEEKQRSANFETQVNFLQTFLSDQHCANQEKIKELERQLWSSSQDLEDQKQDCLYLKKKMDKMLQKNKNLRELLDRKSNILRSQKLTVHKESCCATMKVIRSKFQNN